MVVVGEYNYLFKYKMINELALLTNLDNNMARRLLEKAMYIAIYPNPHLIEGAKQFLLFIAQHKPSFMDEMWSDLRRGKLMESNPGLARGIISTKFNRQYFIESLNSGRSCSHLFTH